MYIHTLIILVSVSLGLGAEDMCCVCLLPGLCNEGKMTSIALTMVGSTPDDIIRSGKTLNDQSCAGDPSLTCCKVPWANGTCSASKPAIGTIIPKEAKWAAYLMRQSGSTEPVASATLFHPQALFVPASALAGLSRIGWKVTLGDEQIDPVFNRYKNMAVETIVPHPQYKPGSTENDIAVVILKKKVRNKTLYSPVKTSRRTKHLDFQTCAITGAGRVLGVTVKQKSIGASYVPKSQCRNATTQGKNVTGDSLKYLECISPTKEEQLCKMKPGASITCRSSQFKQRVLLGIIPKTCGSTPKMTVFTPTRYHLQWAKGVVRTKVPRRTSSKKKRVKKIKKAKSVLDIFKRKGKKKTRKNRTRLRGRRRY